ncbi:hypothetical protein AFLA_007633 [Aspergillus flavus NRRL3357]|nr:hypothetical protein AFLA_007633 [Aspergillus flavus NRRL3357]
MWAPYRSAPQYTAAIDDPDRKGKNLQSPLLLAIVVSQVILSLAQAREHAQKRRQGAECESSTRLVHGHKGYGTFYQTTINNLVSGFRRTSLQNHIDEAYDIIKTP